jgi:hypothetical protein
MNLFSQELERLNSEVYSFLSNIRCIGVLCEDCHKRENR